MTKNSLTTSIILFILAVSLLFFAIKNSSKEDSKTNISIETIKEEVIPYKAKDSMSKVLVVKDFKNSSISHSPTDTFKKTLEVNGTIVGGYIYIKADVDNRALTSFDDIYVKLIESSHGLYKEYGGHLIQSQSLDTPKNDKQTEFLYELSSIKYKKSFTDSDKEVLSGNWLAILNDSTTKKILGFSSTSRNGDMQEMYIYYKCLDNTDCSISISQ
ncbi:MAG: hypothetical protein LiPW30_298 [Parcubacteria group bacterium LiPW_30]|nr:MAG: hypothetical protein LiPW30_298 [Parcubacteria group bacterium LiPW_30]